MGFCPYLDSRKPVSVLAASMSQCDFELYSFWVSKPMPGTL